VAIEVGAEASSILTGATTEAAEGQTREAITRVVAIKVLTAVEIQEEEAITPLIKPAKRQSSRSWSRQPPAAAEADISLTREAATIISPILQEDTIIMRMEATETTTATTTVSTEVDEVAAEVEAVIRTTEAKWTVATIKMRKAEAASGTIRRTIIMVSREVAAGVLLRLSPKMMTVTHPLPLLLPRNE
jgi:hypothetical protein